MNRKEFLRTVTAGAAGTLAGGTSARAAQGSVPTKAVVKVTGDALKGSTRAVVDFITSARLDRFPSDAVVQAKRCLIDGFAVMLAGSTVHGSAIVRKYVRAVGDKGGASILGPERMTASSPRAALANGASGHAMDFDDTQLSTTPDRTYGLLTHPTVPALASTLAVAEEQRASGAAFLEAFLTGFEVECKIAEAIDPEHYVRGFHSTATAGTFAGAASAARLLKLDAARTAHAIGIAASCASGLRVNFGSMTKPLHAGRAAENGIFAAMLAADGFTAGEDGLDGMTAIRELAAHMQGQVDLGGGDLAGSGQGAAFAGLRPDCSFALTRAATSSSAMASAAFQAKRASKRRPDLYSASPRCS